MNRRIIYLLSFFLILESDFSYSQEKEIDSLRILLQTDQKDTNKLIHLYHLSDLSETVGNYPEGIKYGNEALVLAEQLLNNANGINRDRFSQAVVKYKAKIYSNIGIIYDVQGNFPEALKNHLAALKIYDSMNDKRGAARCYNNIGIIYKQQDNYQEALKNHFLSLKIDTELGYKKGIAYSHNNIGNIYSDQAENEKNEAIRLKTLNLALKSYSSSLEILILMDDQRGMASLYNNIGIIYKEQGDYTNALKNHFSSLKTREKTNDKDGIAISSTNIGNVFIRLKKYKEAEEYFNKAIKLSTEIGNKEYLKHTYSGLTELNVAKENYKNAYEYHKLFISYRDSLDNEETRKKTIQNQMTYDFDKKEAIAQAEHKKELESQEAIADEKSRRQKVVILFVVCGLLLVLVFAVFIFRSLRITRKQKNIIELQKNKVEQQKQEVEQQKLMVEEHQKEIIDSIMYARRIQRSLLPTEKYIEKTFSRLRKK